MIDMQVSDMSLTESQCSEAPQITKAIVYICKKCDTKFSRKDNLKRHMRRKHNEEKYEDEDVNKKSVCVYPGCTRSFYHKTKLIDHIEHDHFISCQTENIVFKSMKEFEKWKGQEEASNYIYFSKCSGTAEGKIASYSYYACQKDGESRKHINSSDYCREKTHKNRKGFVKIGTLCPARLQVKSLFSGGVIVKYIKTHSHAIRFEDTQYHPPPKEIKLDIMDKIVKGVPVKDIQQSLMKEDDENDDSIWPKRMKHFMSERSIREMKRKLKSVNPSKEVIFQLREITGKSPEQVRDAYLASNGDIKQAVEILTGNSAMGGDQGAGQMSANEDSSSKVSGQKEVIEISDDRDDDLAKAIELSLRESQGGFGTSISEEDKELSKALEASLVDNRSGNKRKRGNLWLSFIDPENPHDRERKEDVPVGLKNVGNTCWFSAVIQSLFHIPKFRNLVLNCELPENIENIKDQPKLAFLLELQKLFSLLLHSNRKYVDPAKTIEILEDAVRGTGKENPGDQQDVSEFTHVLLDWLEDAFRVHSDSSTARNPIAELFYGRYSVNGCYNGKEVKNEEMFGSLPLHVRGHDHLYDGLDDAMVNNQINTNDQDSSANSTQEHWFTHLPAVLTFELSRFIFNHQFSKAEKIHDPFHIEQTIHLARYMEHNRELTRKKRRLVERAKKKRRELLLKLEKYLWFGSGTKRNSIMTILGATLEFIRKGITDDDNETPMNISPGASPSTSMMQESTNSLLDAAESVEGPSPKNMTSEEGNLMVDCLQRWQGEVDRETETLRRGIEYIDREVKHAYDEEILQQVPYRLHAILVHEGQANGGHYWSYIFDSAKGVWRKFNDVTVTETTWDEVQRESIGGYRNTSAYCLVYVDACRSDLFELNATEEEMPRSIQAYVESDNEIFMKEIEDWDAKQRKMDFTTGGDVCDKENAPITGNKAQSSTQSIPSLDDQLDSFYADQCAKIATSKTNNEITRLASRLESFIAYLYDSKAPSHIIYHGFLEYFVDIVPNQMERVALLQRHAQLKLKRIEEDQVKNTEYLKWKHCYATFLRCCACFISGLEAYYDKRYREGLPCFFHALDINNQLLSNDCKPASMNKHTLSYFRKRCLQHVNDEACRLFESGSIFDVEEGCTLMKELVIPSLPSIFETELEADLLVAENLREKWCTYVGLADIDGRKNELLEEVIMGLVDSSVKVSVRFPSIKGPISGLDLLKRYNNLVVHIENENKQNG